MPAPLEDAIGKHPGSTSLGALKGTVQTLPGFEQCLYDGVEGIKITSDQLNAFKSASAQPKHKDQGLSAYCLQELNVPGREHVIATRSENYSHCLTNATVIVTVAFRFQFAFATHPLVFYPIAI